jgi:hypothetical protein
MLANAQRVRRMNRRSSCRSFAKARTVPMPCSTSSYHAHSRVKKLWCARARAVCARAASAATPAGMGTRQSTATAIVRSSRSIPHAATLTYTSVGPAGRRGR